MSNKTSDKNVANIERLNKFANMTFLYGNRVSLNMDNLKEVQQDLKCLLIELEQDKKRIQELEEENTLLKKASNIAKDVNIDDVTHVINKSYEDFVKNYIPKQVVRDAIDLHKDYILNQATTSNPTLDRHFRDKENYVVNVLLKLLKGEK